MTQTSTSFQIESRIVKEDPSVVELVLEGRLDAEALPDALARIEETRAAGTTRFLIDLERVAFIGSAGIGIFLSLVEETKGEGGGVVFLRVPASIMKIFEVLNVLEFLEIREDAGDAVRHLLSSRDASTS
jgi:anti-sigma B factor antagonist